MAVSAVDALKDCHRTQITWLSPALSQPRVCAHSPSFPLPLHLQVHFVLDEHFRLEDLLRLQLHKYAEDVGEIVDRAQKEEKMELVSRPRRVSGVCVGQLLVWV